MAPATPFGPDRYRELQVRTAPSSDLALLLYDRAIGLLTDAEATFADPTPHRFEKIAQALLHTQAILRELLASLDPERGGEIAQRLAGLYDFMLHALSRAIADHAVEPVREVRQLLTELRDAFRQAAEQAGESPENRQRPPGGGAIRSA